MLLYLFHCPKYTQSVVCIQSLSTSFLRGASPEFESETTVLHDGMKTQLVLDKKTSLHSSWEHPFRKKYSAPTPHIITVLRGREYYRNRKSTWWQPGTGHSTWWHERKYLVLERSQAQLCSALGLVPGGQTHSHFTELTYHTKHHHHLAGLHFTPDLPFLSSQSMLHSLTRSISTILHYSSDELQQHEVTSIEVLVSANSEMPGTMATSEDTQDTVKGSEDTQFSMVKPEDTRTEEKRGREEEGTSNCIRL